MKAALVCVVLLVAVVIGKDEEGDGRAGIGFATGLNLNGTFEITKNPLAGFLRSKRCIVVQKQSGTHGDSNEGTDNNHNPKSSSEENKTEPDPPKPNKILFKKNKKHRMLEFSPKPTQANQEDSDVEVPRE